MTMTPTSNRDEVARPLYDEAITLRRRQEERVNDLRQRATTITSVLVSVIIVAVGLSRQDTSRGMIVLAALLLAVALIAGAYALAPQGKYVEGPNITTLHDVQYMEDHPSGQVLRDLATYHHDNYNANEDGPIRRVTVAVEVQLAAVSMAVLAVLIGYVI
jgi:hypothetical protein